ncbi:MAG: hypothetical protein ACXVUL_09605 [Solirubrobacteraceae bacterium]
MAAKAIGAGRLQISWLADRPGARTRAKIVVATARAMFYRTGTITVHLKVTRAGKKLLEHSVHVDVTAKEIFRPTGRAPIVVVKRFVLG